MNRHLSRPGELDWNKLSWATAGSGASFSDQVEEFHGNGAAIIRKVLHG